MAEPRVVSSFWVGAHLRKAQAAGAFATVARHGDDTAGTVLVKQAWPDRTARVLTPVRGLDGEARWLAATGADPVPDAEAEAYIARQAGFDPDLWVLEIEDARGRHFLEEPVDDPAPRR